MAKPKKSESPTAESYSIPQGYSEGTKKTDTVMNQVALSFYRNGNSFEVVKIHFNSETKEVGNVETVTSCDSEIEALNTFKATVANTLLKRTLTRE